jgi:hypothetical protein
MLTFHVENQLHERVDTFWDDGANSFLELSRRCAQQGSCVMAAIDLHADSMFNFKQLEALMDELGRLEQGDSLSESERDMVVKVKSAALYARQISGYLFLVGD